MLIEGMECLKEMTVNDIQHEILAEIKDLSVQQATFSTKLDSYLENQHRLENDIIALKEAIKPISRHESILKGFLWIIGIMIPAFIYKFIKT